MTDNIYIIDSSSLIDLNRHNPIDVFPSVWKNLESLISKDRLVAPSEVLNEITQGDDQLSKWVKEHANFFRDPTENQIEIVKNILKSYPSMVREDREYDADSWVIALAIEMKSNAQQTLLPIKRIVVTEEKIRGENVRIPFVCQKYQVDTIDIIEMFRIEGWKF
jgi:hypothetical protein